MGPKDMVDSVDTVEIAAPSTRAGHAWRERAFEGLDAVAGGGWMADARAPLWTRPDAAPGVLAEIQGRGL